MGSMMFHKLAYDPKPNPRKPITTIITSLITISTNSLPEQWSQNVMSSIIGGKINARAELLNDPTKEITADRFGMAAAKATVKHFVLLNSISTHNTTSLY